MTSLTKKKGRAIRGHKASLIIINDPYMPIKKATQSQQAQKTALKLFAQGYRPLKNTAFPRIGMFNYGKIRKRFSIITPLVLNQCAGVHAYTIDRKDVPNDVYYSLIRLSNNATIKTYKILCDQINEIS